VEARVGEELAAGPRCAMLTIERDGSRRPVAAISALLSQIVVNGGAVAGTGVESKSDSAYTFLRHRAPTPSRSTSVPPGTMNSVRAQHGVLNQCTGSTRRLGTSSPHNAARSPLFRLIAPSTVDLPYRGQWLPPLDGATERVLLASDKLTASLPLGSAAAWCLKKYWKRPVRL